MSLWRQLSRGLRVLTHRAHADQDVADEVQHYHDQATAAHVKRGLSLADARRAAHLELGNVTAVREEVRSYGWENTVGALVANIRLAARGFARTPGFTATALITLALCLGANLTIFAVIDSILLRPLPFPDADRLVTIYNTYPNAGVLRDGSSLTNYYERRGQIAALAPLALIRIGTSIVGDAGATERTDVIRVTPEFFAAVGVNPASGRGFSEQELTYQTDGVAIVTDEYWRQRLNADPAVLGKSIRVDGSPKTIVGVMPAGFRYLSSDARLLLPLSSSPERRGPGRRHSSNGYDMVARLAPGATIAQAQAQIDAQNAVLERDDPEAKMIAEAGFRSLVKPLRADHVATIRPTLLLLQGGVLLLVLIGAVNLVNLLLIRASGRAKELAIRRSLGASPRHVAVQVVVETVTLCVAGGAAGLAVGVGGIRLLAALGVDQLPLGGHIAFDARLATIALLIATVLGLAISIPIAWLSVRGQLATSLKSESRGGTSGRAAQQLRHGFIVAQVSLAFILLAGSGLLGLSLKRAMAVSTGFRPDHVITARVVLPPHYYADLPRLHALEDRVGEEVRSQPGATAAGTVTNIPFSGQGNSTGFTIEGHVRAPDESLRAHYVYGVAGDYFQALGIPLREGRLLTSDDGQRPERPCVVDEDFARRYWPTGSALGHRLFQGTSQSGEPELFTIVGVVGAVKQMDMTEGQKLGAVYMPFARLTETSFYVVARTAQPPEMFGAAMTRALRGLDPDLTIDGVRTMDVRISDSLIARRSPALLAALFACVALLLAAVGTYGVLSYAVAQRRREIGVRLALGAAPRQIGTQFLSLGLRLLGVGTVVGVAGAWVAGRVMQGLLYDVGSLQVATLAAATVVMTIVSLVACVIPARRAARVDPMVTLGSE